MCRRDRDGVEQGARGRREPRGARQHGIAHGLGDFLSGREHLGHEEGIATRPRVEGGPVDAVLLGEARNRGRRQRRELESHARSRRSEFAEHLPERVKAAQLGLAIAHEQRHWQRLHASGEQAQQIERRVIRPMSVLEHEDRRRPPSKLAHQRSGEVEGSRPGVDRLRQLAVCAFGNVEKWSERTGSEQCVAGAPEHACTVRTVFAEPCKERGLPDTCLPGHEDQAAARAAPHSLDGLAEHRQLVAALDQVARRVGASLNRGMRHNSPILHPFAPVFNQGRDTSPAPPPGIRVARTAFTFVGGTMMTEGPGRARACP